MTRVGHGVASLPVTVSEVMGGYEDRTGGLAGTLDALEVHAILIEAAGPGAPRWAMVVVDLICVNEDLVAAVRQALRARLGIQGAWVAATHTHSGPEAGCRPGGAPTPPDIAGRVVEAALVAASAAMEDDAQARLLVRRVEVAALAGDRTAKGPDAPGLPVDVIVAVAADRLLGLVVVTPAHPTVLGAENAYASADLSGGIRRAVRSRLEAAIGAAPWVVSATGAAGDISTRFTRRGRVPSEVDRLGALVADALMPALDGLARGMGAVAWDGQPAYTSTRTATTVLELGSKATETSTTSSLTVLEADASDADDPRVEHVVRQGVEIASRLRRAGQPDHFRVGLSAVRVEGATLLAVPGELFLSLGEDIRRRSPRPQETVVLGYANGYLGYLPTRDATLGYEVLVSPVAKGSGEKLADVAVELAHAVHDIGEEERSVG